VTECTKLLASLRDAFVVGGGPVVSLVPCSTTGYMLGSLRLHGDATPFGVVRFLPHIPRVALQPWAVWRNPFGIRSRESRTAYIFKIWEPTVKMEWAEACKSQTGRWACQGHDKRRCSGAHYHFEIIWTCPLTPHLSSYPDSHSITESRLTRDKKYKGETRWNFNLFPCFWFIVIFMSSGKSGP